MMKWHTEKMPRLVAGPHAQSSPKDPVIRNYRTTPDDRKLDDDSVLANPHFIDSDTALCGSAFFQSEAKPQVVSAAKDNFRKDDDDHWQLGVPLKDNANFAWVQHFIHHLAA